jgi:hypothetical protein
MTSAIYNLSCFVSCVVLLVADDDLGKMAMISMLDASVLVSEEE